MTRNITAALILMLALIAPTAGAQSSPPTEREKLQALLEESDNLTAQTKKAEKTRGDIAKAELSLKGKQDVVKHAQDDLRRKGEGIVHEVEDVHRQADATGCPWGTTQEASYAKSCNAELARLEGLLAQVKTKAMTLEEYAKNLAETQNALSNETVRLFQKKKANNADLQDLYDARTDWQKRYNAIVFDSEAFRRLKIQAPRSKICEEISTPMTDLALEAAHRCLQRLWDGAR